MIRTRGWFPPSGLTDRRRAGRPRTRPRFRPALSGLEDRRLLTGYTLTTLASFSTNLDTTPISVVLDGSGDLFGTTQYGGLDRSGSVFELPGGSSTATSLASFNGTNGVAPAGPLVPDGHGNYFGTTSGGGADDFGTVFEFSTATGTITTLASFNGTNGESPAGGLVRDANGDLFGTTDSTLQNGGPYGDGTVFELPSGSNTITTLVAFNGANGMIPESGLVSDAQGNFYGTTTGGGPYNSGEVFEIAAGSDTLTTLASFTGGAGGYDPYFPLVIDSNGNIFGTTSRGGSSNLGTVFELASGSNTITTLASFSQATGNAPAGLVLDASGNLFGTVQWGAADNQGALFELPSGSRAYTTVVNFDFYTNGGYPLTNLVTDARGDVFGVTRSGGPGQLGTVFELSPEVSGTSSVALSPSAGSTVYGQPLTLTATVTGSSPGVTPTGTVTFLDGTTVLGTGALSGGTATFTTGALAPGAHALSASYGGDATYPGAASSSASETVSADATTTAVTSTGSPSEAGHPVTFTATVSPAAPGVLTPTGTVQFKVDGKALGAPVAVSGGVAVSPVTGTLAPGPHSVTASFTDASGHFRASTGVLAGGQKVLAFTSTSLAVNPGSSTFGQKVTFTATVTNLDTAASPVGTVSFLDGSTPIGSAYVSGGRAVFATTALAPNVAHSVTAVYNGSTLFGKSTSGAVSPSVTPAPTNILLADASGGPVAFGTPVTLTATVSIGDLAYAPGGAVTFYSGTTVLGRVALVKVGTAAPYRAVASLTTTAIPAGTNALTAVYAGATNFLGGTSNVRNQVILPAATATSLSSASAAVAAGTSATFTAVVTDTDTGMVPAGQVEFLDGSTVLATLALNTHGQAVLSKRLAAGVHTVKAVFLGTASYKTSTSGSVTVTVA
jgi:uncharacterized repeat protein (TIGR03803 family)